MMLFRSRRGVRAVGLGLTLAAGAFAASWSARPVRAQVQQTLPPPPLTINMSAARVQGFIDARARRLNYLPGEVVVKFRDGVTRTGQDRALFALRSRPTSDALRWVGGVAVLKDDLEPDAQILARQLTTQPEVEYAEPNYIRHPTATPNDPSFSTRQWNFTALDLPRAWDIATTPGQGVIVAIVDTGVTTTAGTLLTRTWNGSAFINIAVPIASSPELPASRIVSPIDIVFGGTTVIDFVGHGTHVASTIAEETNNNSAEAGIAYNAKIMPVKVCIGSWELQFLQAQIGIPGVVPADAGGCTSADVASGIRYAADNGAKVINLSLGGPGSSQVEHDAVVYAVSKGVFVAAAGGNGFEDGNVPEFPAGDAPSLKGLMSVAAVGRSLRKAFYSNTGTYIEIAAPGGDSHDGGAAGAIWQMTLQLSDSDPATVIIPRFDRYAETPFQGTSMATPHVAGTAALLVGRGIADPAVIEALLEATAKDLGTTGKDNEFGYGLVQPRAALFGFATKK